jgi:flavin reductase (DIM6/NTAB) family NADH-FMN oxidoreductase RutF
LSIVHQVPPQEFSEATRAFATGVTVVTVRDGRDDIGATVTAFAPVSVQPAMVLISMATESYMSEVLHRRNRWAATLLAVGQRAIAGRFAAAGRPSARLLVAGVPHHRGSLSEALIIDDGVAALECETRHRVAAGDHTLFVAEVSRVDYVSTVMNPLIRYNRRYYTL